MNGRNKARKESIKPQHITVKGKEYIVIDKFMYSSKDYLGQGSFGKVYRGFSVPPDIEREAAIKTFELPERQVGEFTDFEKQTVDSVRKEIVALKMLKHNNIVRLYDVKKLNNIIFMIMELCDGGTLTEYLKLNPETTELEIRYFFSQILNGFKYLRKRNIIHRDVKPENILLKNGVLKIADFGFATQHNTVSHLHSYLGTRATIAPQVIMGTYDDRCDIWSLGATLFYMCFRDYPFKGNYTSEVKLMEIMKKDCIEFPKNSSHISPYLKQAIVLMMRFKEDDRIKWDELFSHPLFQQNLMIEVGLNVFDMNEGGEEDDGNADLNGELIGQQVDAEFQLTDIPNEELKIVEAQADLHLEKIDIKKKCDKIMSQLINRVTFEKGKVNFLKQLAKKLQDFEHTLQGRIIFETSKVEIADHLKALRFGVNKYELIILAGIIQWMSVNKTDKYYPYGSAKNPLNIPEDDWQMFLTQSTDKEKIQRALDKEIDIEKQFVFAQSFKTLSQIISMKSSAIGKVKIDPPFLDEQFTYRQDFFVILVNLCISLSRLLYADVLRIKGNLEQVHKVLPTLVLLDDIFILMSLEHIFVYSEDTPVNFNVFNESRKKNYNEDPINYNVMYERVMRTYEVFFE